MEAEADVCLNRKEVRICPGNDNTNDHDLLERRELLDG